MKDVKKIYQTIENETLRKLNIIMSTWNDLILYDLRQCFSTSGPRPKMGHRAFLEGRQTSINFA